MTSIHFSRWLPFLFISFHCKDEQSCCNAIPPVRAPNTTYGDIRGNDEWGELEGEGGTVLILFVWIHVFVNNFLVVFILLIHTFFISLALSIWTSCDEVLHHPGDCRLLIGASIVIRWSFEFLFCRKLMRLLLSALYHDMNQNSDELCVRLFLGFLSIVVTLILILSESLVVVE